MHNMHIWTTTSHATHLLQVVDVCVLVGDDDLDQTAARVLHILLRLPFVVLAGYGLDNIDAMAIILPKNGVDLAGSERLAAVLCGAELAKFSEER
jgi:hypothetical protein